MPFAQVHYPFENADWFEHHFPGDFIVEYIGQTRGWFYTLHVLATALFDRPAFQTCVSHGIVLGADGQKMSQVAAQLPRRARGLRPRRRRRDALVPHVVADPARRQPGRHRAGHPRRRAPGADPAVERLVLLLALRQRRARRRRATRRSGRPTRPTCSTATCWPRLRELVGDVTDAARRLRRRRAPATRVRGFLDVLTNWYIRRSRDRFWDGEATRARGVRHAVHGARDASRRVAAPLLPLTTEEIWRGLTGGAVGAPDRLADASTTCRPTTRSSPRWTGSARSARRRRPAQGRGPAGAAAAGRADRGRRRTPAALEPFAAIVADEVNVKAVAAARPRDAGEADVRRHAAAHRQRPGRRAAAGQGRPAGDQGRASPATGRSTTTAPSPPAASRWSRGSTPCETVVAGRRRPSAGDRRAARRRLRRARHRR